MIGRAPQLDRGAMRRAWFRALVAGGAIAIAIATSGCGGASASSASSEDTQQKADLYEIGQIQSTFHKALTTKDIELMSSIWAPNATVTTGPGQTLSGTAKIREHWLNSTPFQPANHWVSVTQSNKTRATANGDKGTLFYECYLIDVDTGKVVVVSGADMAVARMDGRWLVTSFVGSTATLDPS